MMADPMHLPAAVAVKFWYINTSSYQHFQTGVAGSSPLHCYFLIDAGQAAFFMQTINVMLQTKQSLICMSIPTLFAKCARTRLHHPCLAFSPDGCSRKSSTSAFWTAAMRQDNDTSLKAATVHSCLYCAASGTCGTASR